MRPLGNRKRIVAFRQPRIDNGDQAERPVLHFGGRAGSRTRDSRTTADGRREDLRARRVLRVIVVKIPSCDETSMCGNCRGGRDGGGKEDAPRRSKDK